MPSAGLRCGSPWPSSPFAVPGQPAGDSGSGRSTTELDRVSVSEPALPCLVARCLNAAGVPAAGDPAPRGGARAASGRHRQGPRTVGAGDPPSGRNGSSRPQRRIARAPHVQRRHACPRGPQAERGSRPVPGQRGRQRVGCAKSDVARELPIRIDRGSVWWRSCPKGTQTHSCSSPVLAE
jgi:hypothetical protein